MTSMKREGNKKIREYDCLRVIATVLVVLGHCTYFRIMTNYGGCDYSVLAAGSSGVFRVFRQITRFINYFHMPLFMALSGALFYISMSNGKYHTIKHVAVDKGKRLMIPFVVVTIAYSVPLKCLSGYYADRVHIVTDILIGQLFLQGNTHLWYIATLFFIFLLAYTLQTCISGKVWAKLAALLGISMVSSAIDIHLISYICEFIFWFYMGFYFEPIRKKVNEKIKFHTVGYETFPILALYILYRAVRGKEAILIRIFAKMLHTALACGLCVYTYSWAYLLSRTSIVESKVYQYLLRDSFGIYLYSDTLNYVILYVGTRMFGNYLFVSGVGATVLYVVRFAVSLLGSVLVTRLLRTSGLKYLY